MAEAKIQLKLGAIEFTGEGEKEWVTAQLDKVLEKAPKLVNIVPQTAMPVITTQLQTDTPAMPDTKIAKLPLATFLKENKATSNQMRKFIATAVWLEAKGKNRLTTGDISKALTDSKQTRLGNPTDCLNKNVTKGFCEKVGKEFFVTEDGKNSLES